MNNKLLIVKTKYYMNADERKQLADDMANMINTGALIIGNEIEHMALMDLETGHLLPVKSPEDKNENEIAG